MFLSVETLHEAPKFFMNMVKRKSRPQTVFTGSENYSGK